ncbi:MAG: RICIN domain-containing protein [Clostridia bacterium]|nr:RICIN domain-containing protein [Clostridia bacterium]
MIAKNKKLKFLTFVLSTILIFSFVGANSFVLAEPTAEAYETDIATEVEEIEESEPLEITDSVDSTEISGMGTAGITSTTSTSTTTTTTTSYEAYAQYEFPDGIYALQSALNSQRWMDIQHNSTTPGAHVHQYAFSGSPSDISNQYGLFHITRVGTTDRYIIRLKYAPTLTFTYSSDGYVVTKSIPANDEEVDINDTFQFIRRDNGFRIKKYNSDKYIAVNRTTASGSAGAPESHLIACESSDFAAGDAGTWLLEGYDTPIPEGVYCFKNTWNSMWMDTQEGKSNLGYHIQQTDYSSVPTEDFTRRALFKVSHVSGTNRSIIRSMINNSLSFEISEGEILTKEIPNVDANVASADTYRIRYYQNAFIIQSCDSTDLVAADYLDDSGAGSLSGSYLIGSYKPIFIGPGTTWLPYRYTGETKQGCVITYPSSWKSEGFVVNTSGSISLKTWSTVINANRPNLEITVEYGDLVTYAHISNTHTMTLVANNPGRLRIETQILVGGSTDNVSYGGYARFYIVPEEGTYYIQNVGSGRYVDVEGPSLNDGAAIHEWDFRTNPQEKWIVEHVANSDGYIRLKSVYSNKYIGIDPNALSYVKQYAVQNNYTLWRIERTSSGNLTFQCKVYQGTDAVMTVPSASTSNGTNLIMAAYTDNTTYRDEWVAYKCNYVYYVNHYYDQGYEIRFNSTGEDISEYQDICSQILLELFGINSSYTVSTYCSCADTCTGTPTTLLDTTTACTHSNTDHKTRSNIKNDIVSLYNAGNDTTAKIAWTGHVLESRSSCSYSSQHVIIMTIGMVTDKSNNNETPDVIRYQRIYTLLHETSHQLGAPDHYCYDESSSNCNNPTNDCWRCDNGLPSKPVCIMTSRTYDIESRLLAGNADTLYCDQCKSSTHSKGILTHLENHHK